MCSTALTITRSIGSTNCSRELGTCGLRRVRLMATITHVFTINCVAEMLGEDRELLVAIVSNSDNFTMEVSSASYTVTMRQSPN